MRKRLITPIPQDCLAPDEGWLNLGGAAVVEVTSEEKDYPVESALDAMSGLNLQMELSQDGTERD
jgi:hypothetical protein